MDQLTDAEKRARFVERDPAARRSTRARDAGAAATRRERQQSRSPVARQVERFRPRHGDAAILGAARAGSRRPSRMWRPIWTATRSSVGAGAAWRTARSMSGWCARSSSHAWSACCARRASGATCGHRPSMATSLCASRATTLLVLDPTDQTREIERFTFPRQPDGERLCLADYFASEDRSPAVVGLPGRHDGRARLEETERVAGGGRLLARRTSCMG